MFLPPKKQALNSLDHFFLSMVQFKHTHRAISSMRLIKIKTEIQTGSAAFDDI